MQKVGVEAVVEGLGAFIGDVGSINRALDQLRPQGTLLQRMFEGITGGLASFGREVLNVAEVALGVLLARAIEFVISKLKDLISSTIDAGAEFQTMSLRLNRLNFNSAINSGLSYNDAMKEATRLTQEQLEWIQRLAIQTPYDAQDVANVFTLARSYGFASKEAQGLTQDITNFAAGMGLGNTEIRRIIVNFGQMVQQGKVTQRELNDLARGAFVPVNDVLKKMEEQTGLTGDAFDDFKKTGEGVQAFFKAFSSLIEERFQGAAQDMARTFQGATANAQDFVKSILGFNVVKPVLDVVGAKIADTLSALTSPANFDRINKAAERLGLAFSGLLADILGGEGLDTDKIADGIVKGLDKLTGWVLTNGPKIKAFFENLGKTIRDKIGPFIETVVDKFNLIKDWVIDNKDLIGGFFKTLGEIISTVFENLTGGKIATGGGLEGFLEGVKEFMQLVIDNKDAIAEWATIIAKVIFWFQVGATVLSVFMGVVIAIIGPILAILAILAGLVGIWTILGGVIAAVAAFIATVLIPGILIGGAIFLGLVAIVAIVIGVLFSLYLTFIFVQTKLQEFVVAAVAIFEELRANVTAKMEDLKTGLLARFQEMVEGASQKVRDLLALVKESVQSMAKAFFDPHWGTIGRDIIEGVANGVRKAAQALAREVIAAVTSAYNAALNAIGAFSPSRLFANVGDFAMQGMAKGITDNARLAVGAMQEAVGAMAAPAMGLPTMVQQYSVGMGPSVSSNITNTNNFNLTVNSGAPTEPILQDYNMMQSLVQG